MFVGRHQGHGIIILGCQVSMILLVFIRYLRSRFALGQLIAIWESIDVPILHVIIILHIRPRPPCLPINLLYCFILVVCQLESIMTGFDLVVHVCSRKAL